MADGQASLITRVADGRACLITRKKIHENGQTDRQTDGHHDSMIESAQWADSMKTTSPGN